MSNDLANTFGPEGLKTQKGFLSWRFRFGKWLILPSLGFWGVNVVRLTTTECHVSIPFSWKTKNPFRSTYFAALAGAAELATGALVKCYLDDHRPYSMLVTESKMVFYKKAKGKTVFKCDQGREVAQAIERAQSSAEGQAFTLISHGYIDDVLVAELQVQWSIKLK